MKAEEPPPAASVDPDYFHRGRPVGLRDRALVVLARYLASGELARLDWRGARRWGRSLVFELGRQGSSRRLLELTGLEALIVWTWVEAHRRPDGSLFGLTADSIRSRLSKLRRRGRRRRGFGRVAA